MRFTALQDFYSDETQSQYVAGLSYAAGLSDEKLRELIPKWIAEGKVVEGGPEATVVGKE
jgi:hypothetical protein